MIPQSVLESLLKYSNTFVFSLITFAIVHGLILVLLQRRKKEETLCNIATYVGYFIIKRYLVYALTIGSFNFAYAHRLMSSNSSIINLIICVIFVDFLYYWKHRFEHTTRILWAAHSVHHSSSEFNLSTALRLPWLTPFYSWMAYLPACWLGFHPGMVAFSIAVVLGFQFLIHTEKFGKNKILDFIFNTPSNHRVHHGSNTEYLDKNYAGIFMVWDRLFGTYQEEKAQVIYGLTTPIGTAEPFKVNFLEFLTLLKTLTLRHPLKSLHAIFSPPGSEMTSK